ncbi:hypothetical protein [Cyanobium sp. ATX-6F1]|uniref:hypothetical protein n=1 Tax=Cyanobium sp. ATX-6F1 TaxID=3137388 RepID=UPI0039BE10A5
MFAYLSSNRRGDLLVQESREASGQGHTELHRRDGSTVSLDLRASGPVLLVPQGARWWCRRWRG